MPNQPNSYANTQVINNDVYAVKDGDTFWGGVTNHNFEILAELNKRPKLTITYGDVEENTMTVKQWQYSVVGNDVLIQLPRQSIPQVDHFNLIIQQDGVEVGRYNDTQEKVINLVSPEYAKIYFEKSGQPLQTYVPNGNDVTITIPDVQIDNKTLTIKQGDNVLGEFDNSENKTITIPTPLISNGTLTLKLGDNVLGSFTSDTDATIVIPSSNPSYGTLTVTQGDNTLGTFNANENATINIPASSNPSYGTLTVTQGDNTLGTFKADEDATVDIPSTTYGTLTVTQGDNTLGTFNANENATINIPASSNASYGTLTVTQGDNTLGTFNANENATINIPSNNVNVSYGTLTVTQGDTTLGTFNSDEDATINIPSSSFDGATFSIKKSEEYNDLNGDPVFTTIQTLNTAENNDINSYNLTINVNNDSVVYNPFTGSQTVNITATSSSADLSDISESISFEVPYTSRPVLPNDPPASVNTETYYIKDVNGTPKSVSKTIQLPVNYVDIHDGDPSDPTTCIGHWHLYNSCELQLNLSAYAKKTDIVTYTNVSEFTNDVGYIAEADADLKYILRSERNVANGVAALNAEGHLVLPSGIEIW